MTIMTKMLTAGGAIAALAAAPAVAQYAPQYGYSYGAPYGNAYGYQQNASAAAAQRCSAAVQQRLSTRVGLQGILGAVLGARTTGGRVLQVTDVRPRRNMVRVRGLANSGANYGAYGVGAYGAVGYGYQPDLTFKCDVDYRGYVRDIDIMRRR
ncbi:MAG TPA: hypothetical protein VFO45_10740 [Sphingomicrobium sp.]|nr:hypothetical protein [Sphingomicrobium sp.]